MSAHRVDGRKRVLCTAEAFGYGPASKLISLLHRFGPPGPVELTFVGHGCAYELCLAGPFQRVIYGDPTDLSRHSPFEQELVGQQALISAMEFSPLRSARQAAITTILLDSLFWMWPSLPCDLDDVDLYLCQNFVGVNERCAACGHPNLLVVPPLTLAEPQQFQSGDRVVMNLGGMDNPAAPREKLLAYATCMFDLTADACRRAGLGLEVYGRRWVVEAIRGRFADRATVFDSLPPPQFLDRLRRAQCLITSPGLEVLYEAFTLGVPVFMLPPQNNSQAFQARCLQQEIPLLPGPQYPELVGTAPLEPCVPPTEAIRQTLQCVDLLEQRPAARDRLRGSIEQFLHAGTGLYQAQRRSQSEFIERMRQTADSLAHGGTREALVRALWG